MRYANTGCYQATRLQGVAAKAALVSPTVTLVLAASHPYLQQRVGPAAGRDEGVMADRRTPPTHKS